MKNIYFENEKFGEILSFDYRDGEKEIISLQQFMQLKNEGKINRVFYNNDQYHTVFPQRIYFQITRKCNLKCSYCYMDASINGEEIPFSDIEKIVDYISEKGVMEVRLTGGEPTLHSCFTDIVRRLQERNIYVSIGTNGCWTGKVLDYLVQVDNMLLIISLDGEEETNQKLRGNNYKIVKENIKKLREVNKECKIRVNTVLTKRNYRNIEKLFLFAKTYHLDYINFIPLKPQVRVKEVKNEMLTAEEYDEAVNEMVRFRKKYNVKFNTSILLTDYAAEIMQDGLYSNKTFCMAGREATNLDYDFQTKMYRLYGCSYCPVANVNYDGRLKEYLLAGEFDIESINKMDGIWKNNDNWFLFRNDYKPNLCLKCFRFGHGCIGACVVQNMDFDYLERTDNINEEIKKQLVNMKENYCKF
jgi:MoaA/NifB/PqqE/SkfB family radical SAM enzyme